MENFRKHLVLKRLRGIMVISIISIIFITVVRTNLYSEIKETIEGINKQISDKISNDIKTNIEKLDYINEYINYNFNKEKDSYDEEEFLSDINNINKGSLFKYIGVVNKDGYLSIGNNKQVYVGDREYFKKAINGEYYISKIDENRLNLEEDIVYSRPLIIDNNVQGAIIGFESKQKLQNNLINNVFSGNINVDVFDNEGNVVLESKGLEKIYREYIDKENIENDSHNVQIFKVEKEPYITVYDEINDSNWYVVSAAPLNEVFKGTQKAIQIFNIAILLILILYVIIASIKDIRERKKLKTMSEIDNLTNLRNLSKFKKDCKEIISKKAKDENYVVLVFDIKNFNIINDMLGHDNGDKVLQDIADNIRDIEFENISGRIGEDIFTLFFKEKCKNDLDEKVRYLNKYIVKYRCIESNLEIRLNIGVFELKGEDNEIGKAIENANAARLESKLNSDYSYYLYDDKLACKIKQKIIVEKDLKNAIKNNEIQLVYQPKVSLENKKIVSAEALIRWKHEKFGYISPAIFIPIAEKNGDINLIGRWVIEEVCKEIKLCIETNEKIVPISVNLSKEELYQTDISNFIKETIEKYDIPAQLLEIEVTETSALNDVEHINKVIKEIKNFGVKISMDDFGTGTSTLCNLKTIEIDTLKIDRSMSTDLETNKKTKSLLKAIINLAKEYNFDVVCEGIENTNQVEILELLNCDMIQGYVYYKPLELKEFKKILKEN
ncbi:bifunctional diguanylate cyclase/phosphodiesterase [Paraclostridium bifermentans]|uniref:bifunctional diguanylate cyclase/phosphodiesterase n=1 Tax=Paraclostridium bifermentans TaxID=1490 RepID=UPI00359C1EAB